MGNELSSEAANRGQEQASSVDLMFPAEQDTFFLAETVCDSVSLTRLPNRDMTQQMTAIMIILSPWTRRSYSGS